MTYTLEEQKRHRKLWIEALESGKYKQGRNRLRSEEDEFCCLGVLCNICPDVEWEHDEDGWLTDGDALAVYSCPPKEAMDWVGLNRPIGEYGETRCLASDNDNELSFAEIAAIIRSEPRGLFRESVE